MWSSGDVVAVRELWKGRVWKARPWIVVQDDPDELVLWIPRGAPTKIPDGSGIPRDAWELTDSPFSRSALRIARSGQLHSTLLFQGQTGLEWYVNLERPLRRTRIGFDYLDRELDLLARPDGTWEWLDEDEFEEAQTLGVIDAIEAAEARRPSACWRSGPFRRAGRTGGRNPTGRFRRCPWAGTMFRGRCCERSGSSSDLSIPPTSRGSRPSGPIRERIGPLVVRMDRTNTASRRVAEKLGFVPDGAGRAKNSEPVEIYRQPS